MITSLFRNRNRAVLLIIEQNYRTNQCNFSMLLKLQSIFSHATLPRRFKHKYVYNMEKAYLRHLQAENKFEISFHYVDASAKVNRQFNFLRQASESVSSFTSRIATNIEKEIMKRTKTKSLSNRLEVALLRNNVEIENAENVACGDIFSDNDHDQVILHVSDKKFNVIMNSPWVSSIALPASIMANFLVYPTKFESVYADKKLSTFSWYKSKDKSHWDLVGNGFIYNTTNTDIGFYLKLTCLPKNQTTEGPQIEAISSVKVDASPGVCPFEIRHKFTENRCKADTFRVVTYNILADLYCDSDYTRQVLHPYCPPYALQIDYRKQLIIRELIGFNADLMCLQEVDRKVYNYDLKPVFESLDFDSDFCQKRGDVAEGLACFFNRNRFRKINSQRLVLSDELDKNALFAEIWEKVKINQELSQRILDRSTVLQVNVLECLDKEAESEVLVVANTHLYFHPDADHIRLLQGGLVVKFLESFIGGLKRDGRRVSLVVCGDFNSVPECGIYQLFTTGSVSSDHQDFNSNAQEAVRDVALSQSIPLRSACGTPQYTNFTAGFAACLDYIFYQHANLEVCQSVPTPTVDELQANTALPSVVFPSDHISLVADLKFITHNK